MLVSASWWWWWWWSNINEITWDQTGQKWARRAERRKKKEKFSRKQWHEFSVYFEEFCSCLCLCEEIKKKRKEKKLFRLLLICLYSLCFENQTRSNWTKLNQTKLNQTKRKATNIPFNAHCLSRFNSIANLLMMQPG